MANLSRRYRPSTFREVSGQGSITEILRKEIEQEKIGHAYLFSGPRGVGKTTAARIFSKAVNCLEPDKGEPCLKCKNCLRVAQGSIDIIEMDAASHTGVDNIREAVVEHVRFVPSELKFKVYIIDEAHMLSTSAWNALLKTVEEPPAHAIFIFATTEKHKVPATIVSRCQRFDFKRIEQVAIIQRLKELSESEGFKVEEDVLRAIASRSEGCLRDAENLLGQLFSLGEKKIDKEVASLVLPPSQLPYAVELLSLAFNRRLKEVMVRIEEIEQEGASLMPLFDDLIGSVRNVMLASASSAEKLASGDESERALAGLVGLVDEKELVNISLLLMERRKDAKQGLDPRFALEMAMYAIAIGATGGDGQRGANSSVPARHEIKTVPKTIEKNADNQDRRDSRTELKVAERPVPQPKAEPEIRSTNLNEARLWWPKLLEALEDHKSLLFILKLAKPVDLRDDKLYVKFQYSYHKQTLLENGKNRLVFEDALRSIAGNPKLVVEAAGDGPDEVNEESNKPKLDTVSKLLENFGGQVVG